MTTRLPQQADPTRIWLRASDSSAASCALLVKLLLDMTEHLVGQRSSLEPRLDFMVSDCSYFKRCTNSQPLESRSSHDETEPQALVTPATVNRTVAHKPVPRPLPPKPKPPKRQANAAPRTREFLPPAEVNRLIEAARKNRYGHRDATMILIAYRHGCVPQSLRTYGGTKWTSMVRSYTSGASRAAVQQSILCAVTSFVPCGGCNGTRRNTIKRHPSCSSLNGAHHSAQQASVA